jgi:large subunit ribosomal protein L22
MADKAVKLNKKAEKPDKAAKPVAKQLVKAHARSLRIAPRKMRLVTNLVKDMRLNDAVTQLQFTNKKGAKMLQKLLQSAAANAENNFSLNRDGLFIKTITCDMGPVLQRSFPRARGSAFMIRRKMSHVNVVLEERPIKAKKKKTAVVPKAVKPEPKEVKAENLDPMTESVTAPSVPPTEEPKLKETHHENDASVVEEKKSPENLRK